MCAPSGGRLCPKGHQKEGLLSYSEKHLRVLVRIQLPSWVSYPLPIWVGGITNTDKNPAFFDFPLSLAVRFESS